MTNLRDVSGLSDLNIKINIDYILKYDYKIESGVLNVEGRLIFESDKIEDFYTAEYNGQAAEHRLITHTNYRIIPIMILLKLMEIGFIAKREKIYLLKRISK